MHPISASVPSQSISITQQRDSASSDETLKDEEESTTPVAESSGFIETNIDAEFFSHANSSNTQNKPTASDQDSVNNIVEENIIEESNALPKAQSTAERYGQLTQLRLKKLKKYRPHHVYSTEKPLHENIFKYCLNFARINGQMPAEQTLIALVTEKLSAEIFFLWARKSQEPYHSHELKKLAQELTGILFGALHQGIPGLLTQFMQEGTTLSAEQWQTWIRHIQHTSDSALMGPFYFHQKIKLFLEGAIGLSDPQQFKESFTSQCSSLILSALHEKRLTPQQLDVWMHNPSYDLELIAQLSKHLKAGDTPEQISLSEKLRLSEIKIRIAIAMQDDWAAIENNSSSTKNPLLLAHIEAMRIYFEALEANAARLNNTNIDAFITQQFDLWLSTQEANSDHEAHLLNALEPEQKNFMRLLRQGPLQQKISFKALLILLEKGLAFNDAAEIIEATSFHNIRHGDPFNYLNDLSDTSKEYLMDFLTEHLNKNIETDLVV